MSDKILLIDGNSIINRAFYGLPDLTNGQGIHTGAIYGFLSTMFKMIEDENASHIAVAFDVHQPTFRHLKYDKYKSGRNPMPEELKQQVPLLKQLLQSMNIMTIEQGGIEADDILGTMATISENHGFAVTILSGDRDLLQIASDTVKVCVPKTVKGKTSIEVYYEKDVIDRYKVNAKQYIELKALKGDSSDAIPGLPGVGEKTAEKLMAEYGSIEEIYNHIDEIKGNSLKKNIAENRELLDLCLFLVTIKRDAELGIHLDDTRIHDMFNENSYKLFKEFELKNFYDRFDGKAGDKSLPEFNVLSVKNEKDILTLNDAIANSKMLGLMLWSYGQNIDHQENDGQLSLFEVEADNRHIFIALCLDNNSVYTVDSDDITVNGVLELIDSCLKSDKCYMYDVKALYPYIDRDDRLASEGCKGLSDIMIGEYLINPLKSEYDMADIAKDRLGITISDYKELFEKKTWQEAIVSDKERFYQYAVLQAYVVANAGPVIESELINADMLDLFYNMEMPVSYVLYEMERQGMLVDKLALKKYGENLESGIADLEKKIYEAAGHEFNISSPKQLAVILFEEMQLPGGKKTKTGYSTSAEVLEKLEPEYPFVRDILEYRTLTKLKSTYADGLAQFIEDDGRIRSSFNQTITATGRISSTEPNLQNIPMRMELGRSIRKVFIPAEGAKLVDADYSQIELRILASMSDDKELIDAYKSGNDIHAITASKVFHIPLEDVDDTMRRNAKAVNFGIVYGISSFGLGQDLSISREEAKKYIDDYFKSYTGIKTFLDSVKQSAKEKGYSETLYKRRRPIPELSSSNFMQRGFGERVAMNAPIQGTAADIMKIAMIAVHDRLLKEKLNSRIILQVHDELVIEAPDAETEKAATILIEEMSNAADLAVKLDVSCHIGNDWYEAK